MRPTIGPVLWRDFRFGMTPEQTADVLRKIDGIKSVEVIRKPKKPTSLRITYTSAGVMVAEKRIGVAPLLENDRLTEVSIVNDSCASVGTEFAKQTALALKEKYPQHGREKVVDGNGVFVQYRFAFWNEGTRVRLSFSESNPGAYIPHTYGTGKVGGALANFANAVADASVESARAECPADIGKRLTTTIDYSSQAAFLAENQENGARQNAKAKELKDSL